MNEYALKIPSVLSKPSCPDKRSIVNELAEIEAGVIGNFDVPPASGLLTFAYFTAGSQAGAGCLRITYPS